MKPWQPRLLIRIAALLIAACANQMQPARQALDDATSAVNAASADAAVYLPEQFKSLQARLADLNAYYGQRDYSTVLANAPSVLADAKGLQQQAASKKAEMAKAAGVEWNSLSTAVSDRLARVASRIKAIGRDRHPPTGVDLSAAKADMGDADSLWSKAQSLHSAGNDTEAVTTGREVENKVNAAADALKLKLVRTKVASE